MRLIYVCLQATREGQASYAHVHEMIRGLEHRGWHVRLLEPSYARSEAAPGALARLLEFARLQLRALRVMHRADIVYVRSHVAAFPVSAWAALARMLTVQELNGTYEDMFLAWPRLRALRPLLTRGQRVQLRMATQVITVTEGLAKWVSRDAHPRRVAVIPNGANTDVFSPDGPIASDLPTPYVGFVGALAPWQGVEIMLAATRDSSWPPGVSLVIVGAGARDNEVRTAAQADERIVYLGPRPYRSVPAIVRGAACMLSVQPALSRTVAGGIHPLKVFEALACGRPVVVSDHPGQADLVRAEKCGWVVPPGDSAAIARAVADAISNPAQADAAGARGRRAIVREHSWDARAEATHQLLKDLVSESRS